jgi:RNA polymerase sigma factor (sigma-70 family)
MGDRRATAPSIELHQVIQLGAVGTWTDGQLLERFVSRGDEVAFQALVERHGAMVLGVCRAVLRDPHEAQDASQAAFLVLLRHAHAIRRTDSVAAWLHGVARRVAGRAKRAAARRRVVECSAIGPQAARDVRREWLDLHEEIDCLPEKYRSPIVLCGLEGYTHEEAARQLGWPVGTVKVRLMRGRNRLRDRLLRRGLVPSALLLSALTSESPAAVATQARLAGKVMTWGGEVPARVALLADSTSRSLLMIKIRTIACTLVAAGGVFLATGWGLHLALAAKANPGQDAAKEQDAPAPIPKPVAEKPAASPDFAKRYDNFQFGTFGNFRPILNDEKGARFQAREIVLYRNGEVIIWNHDTHSAVGPPIRHDDAPITRVEILGGCGGPLYSSDPDLRCFLTRSDESIRFWDGLTGAPKGELKGQAMNRQWELAYSPRTGAFATIARDGRSANLWDMDTLRPLATFPADSSRLIASCLSKDGKILISIGDDRSALLWDVGSGKSFATLRPVSSLVARIVREDGMLDKAKLDDGFWEMVHRLAPKGE